MAPYTPGCVFEYNGRVPAEAFESPVFNSPLEEAVYNNDMDKFRALVKEGASVNARLKIGQMTCIEYAAMMGYTEALTALITHSVCAPALKKYFQLDDVVDRAYMISKDKKTFFGEQAGMMEANRYVAALYTAIIYNQPECVRIMLKYLGRSDPLRQSFFSPNTRNSEMLNASDLAKSLGHTACYEILERWEKEGVQ